MVVKALVHTGDIVGRLAEVEEEPAHKLEEVRECMQEPGSCRNSSARGRCMYQRLEWVSWVEYKMEPCKCRTQGGKQREGVAGCSCGR